MYANTVNAQSSSSKEMVLQCIKINQKRFENRKNTKQQRCEFESLLFRWVTLIQMNQAEPHPATVPEELPISLCSITITAALLNTNCFM